MKIKTHTAMHIEYNIYFPAVVSNVFDYVHFALGNNGNIKKIY